MRARALRNVHWTLRYRMLYVNRVCMYLCVHMKPSTNFRIGKKLKEKWYLDRVWEVLSEYCVAMLKYINSLLLLPCTECKHYHMQFLSAVIYNARHCVCVCECVILLSHENRMKCESEKNHQNGRNYYIWHIVLEWKWKIRTHILEPRYLGFMCIHCFWLQHWISNSFDYHFKAADSYCQQYTHMKNIPVFTMIQSVEQEKKKHLQKHSPPLSNLLLLCLAILEMENR